MTRGKRVFWLTAATLSPLLIAVVVFGGLYLVRDELRRATAVARGPEASSATQYPQEDPAVTFEASTWGELDTQPLEFSISGLPKHTDVTVESTMTDIDGRVWHATAVFDTGPSGTVTDTDPSLRGSYVGVNPTGLITLAKPDQPEPSGSLGGLYFSSEDGWVKLEVKVGSRVLGHATTRRYAAPDVDLRKLTVDDDGIQGTYYWPADATERAQAVLLIAEDRAYAENVAAHLAQAGFPSLALDYAPGSPNDLFLVPVETLAKGLSWLRGQGEVNPEKVAVIGTGRGSEGAALLAAAHPEVHGLALIAPSPAILLGENGHVSGWTIDDVPVPAFDGARGAKPPANTLLPVTKTNGPVLLLCGTQDTRSKTCSTTAELNRRLTAANFTWQVRNHEIEGIGASIADLVPCQPHTEPWGGGTLAGETLAMPEVWDAVTLLFLTDVHTAYIGQGEGPIGAPSGDVN